MTRVLIVIENISFTRDTRVQLIARSLVRAGYAVSVVCPRLAGDPRRAVVDGVSVRFLRSRDLARLGALGHLLEYAYLGVRLGSVALWRTARRQVDVVHLCVPPHVFFPIGLAVRWLGAKLVVDQHDLMPELYAARYGSDGRLVTRLLRWAERGALRAAHEVLVPNGSSARVAIDRACVEPARVSIVLACPDIGTVGPVGPAHHDVRVGYVGNMERQDGIGLLVEAARTIRLDLGRSDVGFVCIGDGSDLPAMRRLAAELGIAEAIDFTGRLPHDEAMRRLADCDVCVQPDRRNAFNDSCTMLKSLEYMALGKPIVAFDLTETVATCRDAALYATGDSPQELARLIVMAADDPGLRERLGTEGRRLIDEVHGWHRSEPVLLGVYRRVSADRRPARSAAEHVERSAV